MHVSKPEGTVDVRIRKRDDSLRVVRRRPRGGGSSYSDWMRICFEYVDTYSTPAWLPSTNPQSESNQPVHPLGHVGFPISRHVSAHSRVTIIPEFAAFSRVQLAPPSPPPRCSAAATFPSPNHRATAGEIEDRREEKARSVPHWLDRLLCLPK